MAALCIECGTNKTFERGAKRCSDCEAALEARSPREDIAARPASEGPAAGTISPGALLTLGVLGQLVGGLAIGVALDAGSSGALFAGALVAWAGGLALLVALIAFGVKIGIQWASSAE